MQNDVKWIEYNDCINLHYFEKVHVNTSSDQYTLRSLVCPDTYMKMTLKSYLQHYLTRIQIKCWLRKELLRQRWKKNIM
jgi:hypothetical protein